MIEVPVGPIPRQRKDRLGIHPSLCYTHSFMKIEDRLKPAPIHHGFGTTDITMLLAVLIWALNFSLVKLALKHISPLGFNGLRLSLASLFLLGVLAVSREKTKLSGKDWGFLVLLGISGNTIYQFLFINGIHLTTASNTAIIIAMAPVFIAIFSWLMNHEKIHSVAWVGILISFAGFYLVITSRSGAAQFTRQTLLGDLLILGGNLFWGIYTVCSRPLLVRMSPLKLTTWTMVFGTLFFLPFSLRDIQKIAYSEVPFFVWVVMFFSGLLALALGYLIWYASVKRVGNTKTAVYDNLVPVFTVIFAYVFLGEKMTLLQAAGALVIFTGVYLTRIGYRAFVKNA